MAQRSQMTQWLQRWRNRRSFRPPRELAFTREGKWFVGITIGLGIAAINTGNNLLYLILGMLLSLIILSGILSNLVLHRIALRRILPSRVHAQQTTLISLALSNQKRSAVSYSVEVADTAIPALAETPPLKPKKCYFLKIAPQQEQRAAYRISFPRRGAYRFSEMKVSTRFPFGLFVKTRRMYDDQELIVWPSLHPVPPIALKHHAHQGQLSHPERGTGIEFLALREMQPGDEIRWVHWPSSARTNKIYVREFESEERPQIHILLWNVFTPTELAAASAASAGSSATAAILPTEQPAAWAALDTAVDLAASLLVHFYQAGHPTHLFTASTPPQSIQSEDDLSRAMQELALVAPLSHAAPPILQGPTLLVLPHDAPQPDTSSAFQILRAPAPSSPASSPVR